MHSAGSARGNFASNPVMCSFSMPPMYPTAAFSLHRCWNAAPWPNGSASVHSTCLLLVLSTVAQGDNPFENIIRFFPNVKQLLDGVLARGGRILVHGNAGHSAQFNCLAVSCGSELSSPQSGGSLLVRPSQAEFQSYWLI